MPDVRHARTPLPHHMTMTSVKFCDMAEFAKFIKFPLKIHFSAKIRADGSPKNEIRTGLASELEFQ